MATGKTMLPRQSRKKGSTSWSIACSVQAKGSALTLAPESGHIRHVTQVIKPSLDRRHPAGRGARIARSSQLCRAPCFPCRYVARGQVAWL